MYPAPASFTPGVVGSVLASVGTGFIGNAYPEYQIDLDSGVILSDTDARSSLVNQSQAFVCRSNSATDHALIVGNRKTTNTTSRTVVAASAQVGLGRSVRQNFSSATLAATAWFSLACMWFRGLDDAEAFEFNVAPWQIFRPRRNVLYFDAAPAGPGIRELTGSLALSFGATADLSRGSVFAESAFTGAADAALQDLPEWDKEAVLGSNDLGRYLDQAYIRGPLDSASALYTHAEPAPTADYSVEMDWLTFAGAATFNSTAALAGRVSGAGFYSMEYIGGTHSGGTPRFELRRYDAGLDAFTVLDSHAFDVARGATYRVVLRMVDSQITASLDGTEILSASDGTLTAPGKAGIYGKTNNVGNWRGDNFLARTLAAVSGWLPKYYDGSAWQPAVSARRYDGSAWQVIAVDPVVM